MRSVGRLIRGLSALFWGLPAALVICVQTAAAQGFAWLGVFGLLGPVAAQGLLCYALWLMGHFQSQERVWIAALDRAKLFALVNLGLSPFLYFYHRYPHIAFFADSVLAMALTSILFLLSLNGLLRRLAAMLPDETVRLETTVFTNVNRALLSVLVLLFLAGALFLRLDALPLYVRFALEFAGLLPYWIFMLLTLLPLAVTMSLLWKIKDAIFLSVFSAAE